MKNSQMSAIRRTSRTSRLLVLIVLMGWLAWLALPESFRGRVEPTAHASALTVTNTNDSGPGSLRQAILDANANAGADAINFHLPNTGINTITPASALPAITDPLVINGFNTAGMYQVELDGSQAGANVDGLFVNDNFAAGGNVTIEGLIINRFGGNGIVLSNTRVNRIEKNRIGTNADGTADLGNGQHGILIIDSSSNAITGNLISGNDGSGVMITGSDSTANLLSDNLIGVALTDFGPRGNDFGPLGNKVGVSIVGGANNNVIGVAPMYSFLASHSNLIAHNTHEGVLMETNGNVVISNTITRNGHDGVLVRNGSDNKIGDSVRNSFNVISGNGAHGVELAGANNNLVRGNVIGMELDPDYFYGFQPLPNSGDGVLISAGASHNTIGGFYDNNIGLTAGNSIAYSTGAGVRVERGDGNILTGNFIGSNSGAGVFVNAPPSGGSNSTLITVNSIYGNGGPGIDLAPAGVTANDAGDTDTGANGLQNFPLLSIVKVDGDGPPYLVGTLNSIPNTKFNLEFFLNETCDGSDNREGSSYLSSYSVTTGGDGNAPFILKDKFERSYILRPGTFITATATDPSGNTSEFSSCVEVQEGGRLGWKPNDTPGTYHVDEGAGSIMLTVERALSTAGTVTVDYQTSSESATAGLDYGQTRGTLVFNDGETSKTITIPIIEDSLREDDEEFTITLMNPTGGASLREEGRGASFYEWPVRVTIVDNDTPPRVIYGLTRENELVSFSVYKPDTFLSKRSINGEKLLAIDFRPATGGLYALGASGHLYIVNLMTGDLTRVGSGAVPHLTEASDIDMDFNPVTDRLRVLDVKDNRNLQLNPDTGEISSVDTPIVARDYYSSGTLYGLAHTNNFAGATATTVYGIQLISSNSRTRLVTLGSLNGSPVSPNAGQLFEVGNGDTYVWMEDVTGFDIADTDRAYASLTAPHIGPKTRLYRINLEHTDGNKRLVGVIGDGTQLIRDISVEPGPTILFKSNLFSVNEDTGEATITVKRTGNPGSIARVNYATSDGTATANSDYLPTSGTLTFAEGETSRTFTIPLINDSLVEGVETVNLILSDASSGAVLGVPSTAKLAIMDEPTEAGTNPIDNAQFFVRQHYLDFLDREPEPGGLDYWTNNITRCAVDALCIQQQRTGTSAAFFVEDEFQQSGYFIYRLYRAALGRQLTYAEYTADRSKVLGGPDLESAKLSFIDEFMRRAAFKALYPDTLTNAQFVNKLFDTADLKPYTDERQRSITALDIGATRSDVLRNMIEDATFVHREYDRAFVLMQYFGYLQRDPEPAGYAFWLDVLNHQAPGDYRRMVCAFITSTEYQGRFSTVITHSNRECQP
jgi:parallel beta-helix repeat protein